MVVSEYNIFQNNILGAHAIWEFAKYYRMHHIEHDCPSLMLTMAVLPLCLNRRVIFGIKERNFKEGSLLKALEEHRDLFSGLQERMEDMAELTLQSVYLGSVSGLFIYERETGIIFPSKKNLPSSLKQQIGRASDYADVLSASKRIGAWFSQVNTSELMLYFNITY